MGQFIFKRKPNNTEGLTDLCFKFTDFYTHGNIEIIPLVTLVTAYEMSDEGMIGDVESFINWTITAYLKD